MGIWQDIESFDDHKLDDEDSFVVFPQGDDKTENYGNDDSQFYYQQIMPRCQELIQLFYDGVESAEKTYFILWYSNLQC